MRRTEYIETLIKLIELNEDDYWLDSFLNLRNGGYLPTGGAGSLNDWGPYYSNEIQSSWFNILYEVLKYLFQQELPINHLNEVLSKWKTNHLIRCSNCSLQYQHPNIFERQIAVKYFEENLKKYIEQNNLEMILNPANSYKNEKANEYRENLINIYKSKNIIIYDFISNNYFCPHCKKQNAETFHDEYQINEVFSGNLELVFI